MDGIFQSLKPIFDYMLSIGNIVLLPIIIFLLATFWFKQKADKAFHAALMIGVGYVGISMVVGYLVTNLSPVVKDMVTRFGLQLSVIDTGTASSKFVAFGTPVGLVYIPIAIAVNFILMTIGFTRTVNIDIWNYWHFAFVGGLVYGTTQNFAFSVVAVALQAALLLYLSDKTQPFVEKFYGIPGVGIPHGTTTVFAALAWPFVKLVEQIPVIKDIDWTAESIQKRLGVFGDPPVMGLILGLILAFLAGRSLPQILQLGVQMAGVFLLISRVVRILVEGLLPVAEQAKVYLSQKYKDRQLFIGLDSALLIGNPAVMATALIMMPVSILLAVILPGNKFLPFADLALFPFVFAMIVPMCKGNILRSVIVSSIVMTIGVYTATYVAESFTAAAVMGGMKPLPAGQLAASVIDGATPTAGLFVFLAKLLP